MPCILQYMLICNKCPLLLFTCFVLYYYYYYYLFCITGLLYNTSLPLSVPSRPSAWQGDQGLQLFPWAAVSPAGHVPGPAEGGPRWILKTLFTARHHGELHKNNKKHKTKVYVILFRFHCFRLQALAMSASSSPLLIHRCYCAWKRVHSWVLDYISEFEWT